LPGDDEEREFLVLMLRRMIADTDELADDILARDKRLVRRCGRDQH
jgi:hypothetical protein